MPISGTVPTLVPPIEIKELDVTLRIGRITTLRSGTLLADGTEQTLVEHTDIGRISGYLDFSNMQVGDTVVLRQYMKLRTDGTYKKYAEETYSGAQSIPVVYVTAKESDFGVRITLQQTAGAAFRSFDHNFLKES